MPDLDLVALLLSFLTNYKTPYIFVLCILSTLNCSVRPHILSLWLFKSLQISAEKRSREVIVLCTVLFCFQRAVTLTNPPKTKGILTNLIWQTEEWRQDPSGCRKAAGARTGAWQRRGVPPQDWAHLGCLVTENVCVKSISLVSCKYLCFSHTES